MDNSLRILYIALLIICSAFFSATEIAFSSVNKMRFKADYGQKGMICRLAEGIMEDYDKNLTTILIGNNFANTVSSAIATVVVLSLGLPSVFATVAMTVLVLIFGEIIPKVLAKQIPEKFCFYTALPIFLLSLILYPLTFAVSLIIKLVSRIWIRGASDSDTVSETDLENIIDIVEGEGVLDEEQCDLLQNALEFDEVLAYEVITPRVDMQALDIRDPYEVNLRKIDESIYSRLPVYEDTPDKIIGILHLNHFYKAFVENERVNIRELLLPVTFVHKTMPLDDVLEKMRESKTHMVVVLDEYAGTMGILTMEDVFEQLVGEIFDESDEIEREFVCIDDTHFEADGDMRIYDFLDEFELDEDDGDFDGDTATLGGWVMTNLSGEASEGDSFVYENLKITVKSTDGRRIERVSVEEIEEMDDGDEKD